MWITYVISLAAIDNDFCPILIDRTPFPPLFISAKHRSTFFSPV